MKTKRENKIYNYVAINFDSQDKEDLLGVLYGANYTTTKCDLTTGGYKDLYVIGEIGFEFEGYNIYAYLENAVGLYEKYSVESIQDLASLLKTGGTLSPQDIVGLIEGSDTVVVDINETDDKVQVRLDNDYSNKIDRALVTPLSTPTSETLVGVDTGKSQIQVYLGDGLELEGDTSPYILNGFRLYKHIVTFDGGIFILTLITNFEEAIEESDIPNLRTIYNNCVSARGEYLNEKCLINNITTTSIIYVTYDTSNIKADGGILDFNDFASFNGDTVTEL